MVDLFDRTLRSSHFAPSTFDFSEVILTLQRPSAKNSAKQGAGRPTGQNPPQCSASRQASASRHRSEAPRPVPVAETDSICCSRQKSRSGRREAVFSGANGFLPAVFPAWPPGVAPFPCTKALAGLAGENAAFADRAAARVIRRKHRSTQHLPFRTCSSLIRWKVRHTRLGATDDSFWVIAAVRASAHVDGAAPQNAVPTKVGTRSTGQRGPSTDGDACEILPARVGCACA